MQRLNEPEPRDAEAALLARVYAMILSWQPTRASEQDAQDATRKESKNDEK